MKPDIWPDTGYQKRPDIRYNPDLKDLKVTLKVMIYTRGGDQVCWEENQVVEMGREYHGCKEEYNVEKREAGSNIILQCNIVAVRKNIKWVKGEGNGNFGEGE